LTSSAPDPADPPSWTDRDDQLHAGFRRIGCRHCGVVVLVRKMSPPQTSVQWTGDRAPCPYLARDAHGSPGRSCPELAGSVEAAVAAGVLPEGPR
jgi:hypothetical protein